MEPSLKLLAFSPPKKKPLQGEGCFWKWRCCQWTKAGASCLAVAGGRKDWWGFFTHGKNGAFLKPKQWRWMEDDLFPFRLRRLFSFHVDFLGCKRMYCKRFRNYIVSLIRGSSSRYIDDLIVSVLIHDRFLQWTRRSRIKRNSRFESRNIHESLFAMKSRGGGPPKRWFIDIKQGVISPPLFGAGGEKGGGRAGGVLKLGGVKPQQKFAPCWRILYMNHPKVHSLFALGLPGVWTWG